VFPQQLQRALLAKLGVLSEALPQPAGAGAAAMEAVAAAAAVWGGKMRRRSRKPGHIDSEQFAIAYREANSSGSRSMRSSRLPVVKFVDISGVGVSKPLVLQSRQAGLQQRGMLRSSRLQVGMWAGEG
jgi:hypothetical protein